MQGARHLADGKGYTASGRPVTLFAPGYSALLSVGERFGLDAVRGARLLSVAALCCTIALSYVLLRRHVYSQKVVVAGTIAVALSSVLLAVYKEAMSEHVFIVVVLLFVLAAEEHVRSPRALWPLAALGCTQLERVLPQIRRNRLHRDRWIAGSRGWLASRHEISPGSWRDRHDRRRPAGGRTGVRWCLGSCDRVTAAFEADPGGAADWSD